MNNTKISFAIATNGKKVEKTKLTIKSIQNTYGNAADIHIGGVIDGFKDQEVNLHDFSDSALNGEKSSPPPW